MKLSVTTPEEEVSPSVTPLTSPPAPGTDGGGSEGSSSGVAEYSGAIIANPSEHRASLRAALLLMLAAWRTCRVQQADTKKRNEDLQNQANNLSRQISLLRQLNNAESQRAAQASSELVRSRSVIEAAQRKLEEIKQEQEKEKEEASRRERRLEEQTIIAENLRNDLIAVRQDLVALESQLNREREKLSKEREDKKALLERVEKAEAAEAAAISLFESVCNESRNRDEALKEIQNLLEEAIQEREKVTTKLSETEKNYAEALKTANNLRDQKKSLEEQLALEEVTAVNLRRSLQIHVEEVGSLRTEVEALTQAAANTRVGTLCMTILRVPLALLQAINFISSPFGRGTY